jgi:hypothetical protein
MSSAPLGQNDRRRVQSADPPTPQSAYDATVPATSGPPPLPLIRRKVSAETAVVVNDVEGAGSPATAPWPLPPSSRAQAADPLEASTPFAASVDIVEPAPDTTASESEGYPTLVTPWWRRVKAPSRPIWIGALVAVVAGGLGFAAGAKPWASHPPTRSVAAAKASPNQHSALPRPPHGAQANARATRVVGSKPSAISTQRAGQAPTTAKALSQASSGNPSSHSTVATNKASSANKAVSSKATPASTSRGRAAPTSLTAKSKAAVH